MKLSVGSNNTLFKLLLLQSLHLRSLLLMIAHTSGSAFPESRIEHTDANVKQEVGQNASMVLPYPDFHQAALSTRTSS
jgi:hypothetical protein